MNIASLIRNVLIPAWILAFGLVVLCNPPLGAAASLGLFVVGVCVLPATALMFGATGWRASLLAP